MANTTWRTDEGEVLDLAPVANMWMRRRKERRISEAKYHYSLRNTYTPESTHLQRNKMTRRGDACGWKSFVVGLTTLDTSGIDQNGS